MASVATPPHPNAREATATATATVADVSHDFRLANGRLARRLRKEKAEHELTSGQFSALCCLFVEGPLTLGELSDHERVTPPSMNRTVKALVEAGIVSREGSADDGRKVVLTTTPTGEALMRETRKRRDAWLRQRVEKLTPAQRQVLADATVIMRELTES